MDLTEYESDSYIVIIIEILYNFAKSFTNNSF